MHQSIAALLRLFLSIFLFDSCHRGLSPYLALATLTNHCIYSLCLFVGDYSRLCTLPFGQRFESQGVVLGGGKGAKPATTGSGCSDPGSVCQSLGLVAEEPGVDKFGAFIFDNEMESAGPTCCVAALRVCVCVCQGLLCRANKQVDAPNVASLSENDQCESAT